MWHAAFLTGMAFINVLGLYEFTEKLDKKYGEEGWANAALPWRWIVFAVGLA